MYRSAIESILGLIVTDKNLTLKPCIPQSWDQFEINYRKGKTNYHILVLNNQAESSMEMNGMKLPDMLIPLLDDGKDHQIKFNLHH
jgi:cellobiose phosphorylase